MPTGAPFTAAQGGAHGLVVLAASPALAGEPVTVPCPSAQPPGRGAPTPWHCCVRCVCRGMPVHSTAGTVALCDGSVCLTAVLSVMADVTGTLQI